MISQTIIRFTRRASRHVAFKLASIEIVNRLSPPVSHRAGVVELLVEVDSRLVEVGLGLGGIAQKLRARTPDIGLGDDVVNVLKQSELSATLELKRDVLGFVTHASAPSLSGDKAYGGGGRR